MKFLVNNVDRLYEMAGRRWVKRYLGKHIAEGIDDIRHYIVRQAKAEEEFMARMGNLFAARISKLEVRVDKLEPKKPKADPPTLRELCERNSRKES